MYLPARTDELPPDVRYDFARVNALGMQELAEEHWALHEYATAAAVDVTAAVIPGPHLPYAEILFGLAGQFVANRTSTDEARTANKGALAAMFISPKGEQPTSVSETTIFRDIMQDLHPDKIGEEDQESADLMQRLTAADSTGDTATLQGLYAKVFTQNIVEDETLGAEDLEFAQYKAWLAMQASQTRFDSLEEVDVWRYHMLMGGGEARQRGIVMMTAMNLYQAALGGKPGQQFQVPPGQAAAIKDSFRQVLERNQWLSSFDRTPDDFENIHVDQFDAAMLRLTGQFEHFFANYEGQEQIPTDASQWWFNFDRMTSMNQQLGALAGTLEPVQPQELDLESFTYRVLGRLQAEERYLPKHIPVIKDKYCS